MIRVSADSGAPFVEYALELISRFLGIEATLVTNRGCDIYYGNDVSVDCAIRIPLLENFSERDVPLNPPSAPATDPAAPFPFDLFSAMRFWLTDEANRSAQSDLLDRHDRLGLVESAQGRCGEPKVPIVNAHMLLFGRWLEARLETHLSGGLPEGKKAAIVLSHDVDEPIDPGDRKHNRKYQRTMLMRAIAMALRGKIRNSASTALSLFKWSAARRSADGERHWLFHEVLDLEAQHGFHSTFFFAVKTLYDRDGSVYDVAYDFRDPRFESVYREIADRGSEVGLHISYNARESAERIAEERRALEQTAATAIRGSRHHYWHLSHPAWRTLTDHGHAGLQYDASIAFNDAPGYRLGIGFPFYPWDPEQGRKISTLQVPTFMMDAALLRAAGGDAPSARTLFVEWLEELKQNRGVAAIDWHVRTSYPGSKAFEQMGRAYGEILEVLASDSEVWVGSCAEIAAQFEAA